MQEKDSTSTIINLNNVHFIDSLRQFRKFISSSVGVHGNLNVFVTGGGYVQITSSSSQLTNYSDQLNNPLVQLIANVMKSQDDFGLYVGILIASILENSVEFENNQLLDRREKLVNFLVESFPLVCHSSKMKIPINYDSIMDFIPLVQTVITSKFAHRLSKSSIHELSTLIVKSFLYSLDDENMTLGKVLINVYEGRQLFKYIPGVLFQLIEFDDDWICENSAKLRGTEIKILLFTTSLDFDIMNDDCDNQYTFDISPEGRRTHIFQMLEHAITLGVRLIACQKVMNNELSLFLRRKSVIAVHRMGTELAKHLENSTGAFPISHLKQISTENIHEMVGVVDAVDVIQFGSRKFLLMKNHRLKTGTLLIQLPSFASVHQLKIVVEQALNSLQKLSVSPYICPGASCFEICLWIQIQELGRKKFGKIRWEWLLKTLVKASGSKLPLWTDSIYNHAWENEDSSSCNCHLVTRDMAEKSGANWSYLNSFDSRIEITNDICSNIETLKISGGCILDSFYLKSNAVSVSLETCLNLCSIGSIVYRKRL